MSAVKRLFRDYGLTLCFAALFLLSLIGQAISGLADFNDEQIREGLQTIGMGRYLISSSFTVDVSENWQSEYLQFLTYIYATVWLIQKGSPESKQLSDVGPESDEDQKVGEHAEDDSPRWAKVRGFRLIVYSHSLIAVMGGIFLGSWLAQSIAGRAAYNQEQLQSLQDPLTWGAYVSSADFWNRTMQNWQSEFLAVLSMVVFSIFLRQRGSPQSKPVGTPHEATGVEG